MPKIYTNWAAVPLVLDTAQAAQLLQLSPEYTARMCREGKIPAMQIGAGSWRIDREVIRERLSGVVREPDS